MSASAAANGIVPFRVMLLAGSAHKQQRQKRAGEATLEPSGDATRTPASEKAPSPARNASPKAMAIATMVSRRAASLMYFYL